MIAMQSYFLESFAVDPAVPESWFSSESVFLDGAVNGDTLPASSL